MIEVKWERGEGTEQRLFRLLEELSEDWNAFDFMSWMSWEGWVWGGAALENQKTHRFYLLSLQKALLQHKWYWYEII